MPMRDYYTVDRSPQEIRDLWDWACDECAGKLEHENPYAMGVLAAMEYLMGENEDLPQAYKGVFNLSNVLRQSKRSDEVGSVSESRVNKPLYNDLDSFRPGNPKTLLYKAPLLGGDVAGGQSGVNDGGEALRGNPDYGSGQS